MSVYRKSFKKLRKRVEKMPGGPRAKASRAAFFRKELTIIFKTLKILAKEDYAFKYESFRNPEKIFEVF